MPISVSQWHNLLGKLFAELNGKKKHLTIAAIIRLNSLQTLLSFCSSQLYGIEVKVILDLFILFNILKLLVFWQFGMVFGILA